MFVYILLELDSLTRLKSKGCAAVVFPVIYKQKQTANHLLCILNDFGRTDTTIAVFSCTHFNARNRLPGNSGLVGGAQTSKGALTVQKVRMLHFYQLQGLSGNSSCKQIKIKKINYSITNTCIVDKLI